MKKYDNYNGPGCIGCGFYKVLRRVVEDGTNEKTMIVNDGCTFQGDCIKRSLPSEVSALI